MHKYIKLFLAVLLSLASTYMFTIGDYGWGILLILINLIPLFFYFRNEYILLAFWQMRKQNLDGAKKWLSKITNPKAQLVNKQMGYYNFILGVSQGQNNINQSESYMRKALDYGLSFAHDRAMAKLNIAAAVMSRGRKQEAKKWLSEAKTEDKQNMLTEHIKMMEEQMKRVNIGRNMHNPNMRRRGKFF